MSEPYVTLRPLTAEDTSELQAVYDDSPGYFRIFGLERVSPDQAGKDFATAQADRRALLGLFDKEGAMVGAFDLKMHYPTPGTTYIGLLLVREARQRQGIGALAYRILEHWLHTEQQVEVMQLAVEATNVAALRFFQRLGFELTGEAERRLVGRKRARFLTMEKKLT